MPVPGTIEIDGQSCVFVWSRKYPDDHPTKFGLETFLEIVKLHQSRVPDGLPIVSIEPTTGFNPSEDTYDMSAEFVYWPKDDRVCLATVEIEEFPIQEFIKKITQKLETHGLNVNEIRPDTLDVEGELCQFVWLCKYGKAVRTVTPGIVNFFKTARHHTLPRDYPAINIEQTVEYPHPAGVWHVCAGFSYRNSNEEIHRSSIPITSHSFDEFKEKTVAKLEERGLKVTKQ